MRPDLLLPPDDLADLHAHRAWFGRIGTDLLGPTRLRAGAALFALTEIELYYVGGDHRDPFAHAAPQQLTCGQWYFHRAGKSYRGGSFKGLDLTFGDEESYGGILIRSIQAVSGERICGPSLVVDRLLAETGHARVADLDAAIVAAGGPHTDDSPLGLVHQDDEPDPALVWTARVGLTLKRAAEHPEMPRFIGMPYRALRSPAASSKGRVLTAVALLANGEAPGAVAVALGARHTILERWLAAFEAGRTLQEPAPFIGVDLDGDELARMLGWWSASFGEDT